MAAAEMGCQSATLSREILTKLAETPYDANTQPGEGRPKPAHAYDAPESLPARLQPLLKHDPLTEGWDGSSPSTDVDYLADGGAALQAAIEADPATQKRVRDALEFFVDAEERSRKRIEAVMAAVA